MGRLWSLEGPTWAATAIILQHGTAGPNLEERAAVEEGAEWKAGERLTSLTVGDQLLGSHLVFLLSKSPTSQNRPK